ncbi:GNAT family N-acetyltransferase [Actinocrinis puniceicyclus]|uniref:GNAT family N-acetyltransferase n=1 Tax=Actinocrinis puniceicyclus TaxID=977794 RepID=A0A8J7WRQ6_9ACTN|nr:GNAT family N-acetyltransferase [Actinocrinis puniceicyclus]MBS2966303.1 GNAT family N-acetyltransferase [Actinocrinis puniceicyclus]
MPHEDANTPREPGARPQAGPAPGRDEADGPDLTGIMLTTGRLVLTAPGAADTEAIHRMCQDAAIQRWTTLPSPYEREHARDFVERFVPQGLKAGTDAVFGVYHNVGGQLLGMVGLHAISGTEAKNGAMAQVGYWTAAEARGHGYTAEAVRAVCRWGLERLGLQRIEWFAFEGNEGSRAVALRAGFTLEGKLRSRYVHRGRRVDAWIGSLLPGDPL